MNYVTGYVTGFVKNNIPFYKSCESLYKTYNNYEKKTAENNKQINILEKVQKKSKETLEKGYVGKNGRVYPIKSEQVKKDFQNRIGSIDEKIEDLENLNRKERNVAILSAVTEVVKPVSNTILPGSGAYVGMASTACKNVYNNSFYEEGDEHRRSILSGVIVGKIKGVVTKQINEGVKFLFGAQ